MIVGFLHSKNAIGMGFPDGYCPERVGRRHDDLSVGIARVDALIIRCYAESRNRV